MRTHSIPSYERKSKIYPDCVSAPGAMIDTHKLELALFEHNSMVPKVFESLKLLAGQICEIIVHFLI